MFAQWCKSKTHSTDSKGKIKEKRKYVKQVKNVLTESYDRFEENDLFLKFKYHRKLRYRSRIDIVVGRINISAIIDYSAPVNIIDKHLWEYLKKQKISCTLQLSKIKLCVSWSRRSLIVGGCFAALLTVFGNDKSLEGVTFYMIDEKEQPP